MRQTAATEVKRERFNTAHKFNQSRHVLDSSCFSESFPTQMRSGAVCVLVLWMFISSFLLAGCHRRAAEKLDPNAPVEVVIPEHGVYTGAFIEFGGEEDDVTLELIEDFEAMVGKHQAIVASSSYWGEQDFPTESVKVIWEHKSLPLIFWSPWDQPYEQNKGPDRFGLNTILAGTWDKLHRSMG